MSPSLPLSVIVPTRDTCALTLRCLAALDDAGAREAEVIVIDDGGRDGTAEAVGARFPFVRVVTRGMSGGFTAAVNEAWPLATREIVLLLNSDTEVDPHALTGFVAAFAADPRLGVAGASLRHPDGRPQWSAGREPSARWLFALASGAAAALGRVPGWRRLRHESQASLRDVGSRAGNGPAGGAGGGTVRGGQSGDARGTADRGIAGGGGSDPAGGDSRSSDDVRGRSAAAVRAIEADWVPATAMAVRRDVIAAIGLFDPAFVTYAQDLDYCTRARAAGWRVAQLADVRVMHVLGATIDRLGGRLGTRLGSGHGGPPTPHADDRRIVTARQDPRALFVDLSRWIRKRHAGAPARARRLERALTAGVATRIAARQAMRQFLSEADRMAWDHETGRYREAAAALAHARARDADQR